MKEIKKITEFKRWKDESWNKLKENRKQKMKEWKIKEIKKKTKYERIKDERTWKENRKQKMKEWKVKKLKQKQKAKEERMKDETN